MANTKKVKNDEIADTSLVKMSRMDFEIAKFVYEESLRKGIGTNEVSFLLGKKDAYFFDLLDPTDKNKFKTEQPDLLPAILDCTIRQIIPNDIQPDEQVTIIGKKMVRDTKQYKTITYTFTVEYKNELTEDFIWKKKEIKGERSKENKLVTSTLLDLLNDGYFKAPKYALTIYLLLLDKLDKSFTVKDIQTSLAILSRENKKPVLERGEERSRFIYGLYGRVTNACGRFFEKAPSTWGLRGDSLLWNEMKAALGKTDLSTNAKELNTRLRESFKKLTGEKVEKGHQIYVKRFNIDGMSGGFVSCNFWLEEGFPLIVKRYLEEVER